MHNPDSPVCPHFNRLMLAIARDLMPEGWDVVDSEDFPNTLEAARAYYAKNGRVAVDKTSVTGCTMGDPEAHYAFRAWHDLIHILYGEADFTLAGERFAADVHRAEIFKRIGYTQEAVWFGALVEIEIVAQNAHNIRLGYYPPDPRAFALKWLEDRGFVSPPSLPTPGPKPEPEVTQAANA